MADAPNDTNRTKFLLTSLVILIVFILTLAFLVAAYPVLLAPTIPITQTSYPTATLTLSPTITPIPSATHTQRPTFTPTITSTPTETPTPTLTPTPTGPPTLTPARPVAIDNNYQLVTWSADRADYLINLLQYYPNTFGVKARGQQNSVYYQAYSYAATALQEALLRFPAAPQAIQWRWSLAYDQALIGDLQAGNSYASLITQALNRGETDRDGLTDWFRSHEPRLDLYDVRMKPLSGYLGSDLLEIRGQGSAFLWLLETPGSFQALALTSDFDFVHAPQARSVVADLTGDGIEEAAIFQSVPQDTFNLAPPRVFDLSQVPARELFFHPIGVQLNFGTAYANNWIVAKDDAGGNDLALETSVLPACPVTIRRFYHWDGSGFAFTRADYAVAPGPGALSFCRFSVDQAANAWGPAAAIQIIKPLIPIWPPAQDENGKPFPPDARDEWRFRLGLFQAVNGEAEAAVQTLTQITLSPSAPDSRWVAPARAFLNTYHQPQDIYRACVSAPLCSPADAIRYLVGSLAVNGTGKAAPDPVEFLWQSGVTLRSSGYFDFDADGQLERWFTVRHRPGEKLEFWILAPFHDGYKALLVNTVESDKPTLTNQDPQQTPPPVWLNGTDAFKLHHDPKNGEPYLEHFPVQYIWPNRFLQGLQSARERLFSGATPASVEKELLALQETPGLVCRGTWSCDPYYYLLGLSSELAGDTKGATEAYLRLWLDYSLSPYTTMARLKLSGLAVQPSVTPTASITPTGQPTASPTLTGTPQTPTPSLTPGTLTPSPTPVTPTPYP